MEIWLFAFCLWNSMMKERAPYQVWIGQYNMKMPRCIVMNAATIHQIHHSWVPQIYIPDAITSHISKICLSSILQQSMSKKPTYNWGAKKWQHFKRAVTAEASHAFGQPRILWAAKCVQSSNINILVKCCLGQFGSVLGIEPGPPGWDPCVLTTGPYHSH